MNITSMNLLAVVAIAVTSLASQSGAPAQQPACQVSGGLVGLRNLPEASGVAASRRSPGVFWAHNDSGDPVLFALDRQGAVTGRVRVTGATVDDWEDVAVGPCGRESCLYIADIGDNGGNRASIAVYRVVEPAAGDAGTGPVETFHGSYPDGAHDAESLFITPDGELFIITKGDPGPVALYRFPPLKPGAALQLQRVGQPLATGKIDSEDRPTAADASADGRWVAVRTTRYVAFYRTADLIAGQWREAFRTDLRALDEPRGEGVTFAGDGTVVLVGESGGAGRRGTFARLSCTLPR